MNFEFKYLPEMFDYVGAAEKFAELYGDKIRWNDEKVHSYKGDKLWERFVDGKWEPCDRQVIDTYVDEFTAAMLKEVEEFAWHELERLKEEMPAYVLSLKSGKIFSKPVAAYATFANKLNTPSGKNSMLHEAKRRLTPWYKLNGGKSFDELVKEDEDD